VHRLDRNGLVDRRQERSLVMMTALMFFLGIATFALMLGFLSLCEKV